MSNEAKEIAVNEAADDLRELVGRTANHQDRFLLTQDGKRLAALVSVDDLDYLVRTRATVDPQQPAIAADEFPVLAAIWDNDDDRIFDNL